MWLFHVEDSFVGGPLSQPGVQTICSHLLVLLLQAYYGGEAVCAEAASDDYDPKELVCGGCSDVTAAQVSFGYE